MRTFHREKHDWGYRDFYFHLDATVEFVERTGQYVTVRHGDIQYFDNITDARKHIKKGATPQ